MSAFGGGIAFEKVLGVRRRKSDPIPGTLEVPVVPATGMLSPEPRKVSLLHGGN
jgi:hypothetical protein